MAISNFLHKKNKTDIIALEMIGKYKIFIGIFASILKTLINKYCKDSEWLVCCVIVNFNGLCIFFYN